ncbi:SseB family protein [Citricoccus nitrophenolicus]|uniref:Type III secretion system (T3SS) SseB-like protein n=1 Tax=Citricoccus muralis TaxID=169134 RepID=A0A3D9L929_9MICC|nr:SseB family protein [Citricoccus muralis]REE02602.1 type III secretion system (T3SS) SseB-like protein [Citricoccus muralis]
MTGPDSGPHLPGHIQAAIQRNLERQHRDDAGRPADSAGLAWEGRDLSGDGIDGSANPLHAFDTDDGTADPAWGPVLDRLADGEAGEPAVVDVLSRMRVFAAVLPTVAEMAHDHDGHSHGDKESDIALVTLKAPDGRTALPVFTNVPALTAWHPQARPVATWMPRACLSAVDEGAELVVVDPAAERTFVVRRPAVWALAQQQDWTPSYADEALADELASLVDLVPGLAQIGLAPGSGVASRTASGAVLPGGGSGPELQLVAYPDAELASAQDEAGLRLLAATLQQVLGEVPSLAEKADSVEITIGRPTHT